MNVNRIITSATNPSDYVFMTCQCATASGMEDQMLQKIFVPAIRIPEIYFEIPENSTLPIEFDEYFGRNIRILVESGQISDARLLLSSIPSGISSKLDNWRRVLAIPKARIGKTATGVDIKQNSSWLLNNSGKFKGKWVALKEGILVGSHQSRLELHKQLTLTNKLKGTAFFKICND
jgi:hypothetical protein